MNVGVLFRVWRVLFLKVCYVVFRAGVYLVFWFEFIRICWIKHVGRLLDENRRFYTLTLVSCRFIISGPLSAYIYFLPARDYYCVLVGSRGFDSVMVLEESCL